MMEKNKQTNNFEDMWDDEMLSRFEPHFKTVEKKLQKTHQTAQVTGEVVDLFFTKIFQVMLGMLGAPPQDSPQKATNTTKQGQQKMGFKPQLNGIKKGRKGEDVSEMPS